MNTYDRLVKEEKMSAREIIMSKKLTAKQIIQGSKNHMLVISPVGDKDRFALWIDGEKRLPHIIGGFLSQTSQGEYEIEITRAEDPIDSALIREALKPNSQVEIYFPKKLPYAKFIPGFFDLEMPETEMTFGQIQNDYKNAQDYWEQFDALSDAWELGYDNAEAIAKSGYKFDHYPKLRRAFFMGIDAARSCEREHHDNYFRALESDCEDILGPHTYY